eukprot:7425460-Ditylum_brightwellii.AAC.1
MKIDQADDSSNAMTTVHASPRLASALKALSELTNYENLPMRGTLDHLSAHTKACNTALESVDTFSAKAHQTGMNLGI